MSRRMLAVLMIAVLLLAACTGDDDAATTDVERPATTATTTDELDVESATTPRPRTRRRLTPRFEAAPSSLPSAAIRAT